MMRRSPRSPLSSIQLMRTSLLLLLLGFGYFGAPCRGAEPTLFETAHPFRAVSRWLVSSNGAVTGRSKVSNNGSPPPFLRNEGAVKRALLMLSKTQLMTKGVDGAAFKLSVATRRGAAARSNITAELAKLHAVVGSKGATREEENEGGNKALDGAAASSLESSGAATASSRPTVAAAKLVHKAQTVQRALRAAELVELARLAQHIMLQHRRAAAVDSAAGGANGRAGAMRAVSGDAGWAAAARAAGVELAAAPVYLPVQRGDDEEEEEEEEEKEGEEGAGMVCALVLRDVAAAGEQHDANATATMAGGAAAVSAARGAHTSHTLVLSDTIRGAALLRSLAPEPVMVRCRQPAVKPPGDAAAAAAAAGAAAATAAVSPSATLQPPRVYRRAAVAPAVLRTATAVCQALAPFLAGEETALEAAAVASGNGTAASSSSSSSTTEGRSKGVRHLECVGHSFSGSIAAVVAALLDGTLVAEDVDDSGAAATDVGSAGKAVATAKKKNQRGNGAAAEAPCIETPCVVLGPCPCVGSAVSLPGVTSVVLGDDLFARLQWSSLRRLQERVGRFLVTSDGDKAGVLDASKGAMKLAAKLSTAWVGDAFGSTVRNIQHRSAMDAKRKKQQKNAAKKNPKIGGVGGDDGAGRDADGKATAAAERLEGQAADSEETEEQLLLCPGIVYLLKPRASGDIVVTTTKRGGLGEALLMSMHDVLLSKSMLAHHLLEAYIQALDRI